MLREKDYLCYWLILILKAKSKCTDKQRTTIRVRENSEKWAWLKNDEESTWHDCLTYLVCIYIYFRDMLSLVDCCLPLYLSLYVCMCFSEFTVVSMCVGLMRYSLRVRAVFIIIMHCPLQSFLRITIHVSLQKQTSATTTEIRLS